MKILTAAKQMLEALEKFEVVVLSSMALEGVVFEDGGGGVKLEHGGDGLAPGMAAQGVDGLRPSEPEQAGWSVRSVLGVECRIGGQFERNPAPAAGRLVIGMLAGSALGSE